MFSIAICVNSAPGGAPNTHNHVVASWSSQRKLIILYKIHE